MRHVLHVLAQRFPVLGVGALAGPVFVVNVTVYLVVVPLCVGLELLFLNHPGESLFFPLFLSASASSYSSSTILASHSFSVRSLE